MAISSNYSEIIAIYKTSQEYIWLRSIIQHIKKMDCQPLKIVP
jgi:hypothetical protein